MVLFSCAKSKGRADVPILRLRTRHSWVKFDEWTITPRFDMFREPLRFSTSEFWTAFLGWQALSLTPGTILNQTGPRHRQWTIAPIVEAYFMHFA